MARFVDIGTPLPTVASDLQPGTLVRFGNPANPAGPGIISEGRNVVSLSTGEIWAGCTIVIPLSPGQTITLAQE